MSGPEFIAPPGPAEDVVALRAKITELLTPPNIHGVDMLARLDRIAAQVPEPSQVWLHRCGAIRIGDTEPQPCMVCAGPSAWDRLYTLGGDAR